jgi:hypothetical protein
MMVTTLCRHLQTATFNQAITCKVGKYGLALVDSLIAKVVPFIMSPFGVLSRPTKAFLKHTMGDMTTTKITKAHLHLTVAAIQGTAQLSYAWAACTTLSVGK